MKKFKNTGSAQLCYKDSLHTISNLFWSACETAEHSKTHWNLLALDTCQCPPNQCIANFSSGLSIKILYLFHLYFIYLVKKYNKRGLDKFICQKKSFEKIKSGQVELSLPIVRVGKKRKGLPLSACPKVRLLVAFSYMLPKIFLLCSVLISCGWHTLHISAHVLDKVCVL